MYQSKFIRHYRALTKPERARLRKWGDSPLHTPQTAVQKLIHYVIDLRKLTPKALDSGLVFSVVYGKEQPYDDLKMRHLLSDGVKNLRQFVGFLVQENDTLEQQKNRIAWYQQRDLEDLAAKELGKAQQELAQFPYQNEQFYSHQYQLEVLQFELQGTQQRGNATNIQPILTHLEHQVALQILRWSCIALTHQNVYNTHYQLPFTDAVLAKAQQQQYADQPTIQLYYHAYGCLAMPDQLAYFEALKAQLLESGHLLPTDEQRHLYLIAINYCIKQLNKNGNPFFMRELFVLYQAALDSAVLLEEGFLSPYSFANINALALRLQEFEWSAGFIRQYAPLLRPDVRQAYQHHAKAKLAFAQADYDRAQQLLLYADYEDTLLTIDARIMLLKIYYLHDQQDLLDALLTSLSRYLERQKMLSYHRDNYRHIIRLVRRLLYLAPYDREGRAKLREDIQATHPLTERDWLLEQL